METFWEENGGAILKFLLNFALVVLFASLLSRGVTLAHKFMRAKLANQVFATKTFAQLAKILIWCVAGIIIIANLLGKSPAFVLSGLGAFMAVLMLIFRDSLLGLVAGIQLAQNDMVRLGDWIEMPKFHADGTVIDIALTTIKVQNFDNTVTMIPSSALISDSFINWRYMSESKGRRVKRSLLISAVSVCEMSDAMQSDFAKNGLIGANEKFTSNLAAFEEWIRRFLAKNDEISKELTCLVRQLEAKSEGIPVEIYCFTKTRDWLEYERIQTELFDRLFVTASQFKLAIFERTGARAI